MSEYFMSKNEVVAELSKLEKQGAELLFYRNNVWLIREKAEYYSEFENGNYITCFNTQQDGICEIDIIKASDKHSKSIYPLTFKEQIDLYKAGK